MGFMDSLKDALGGDREDDAKAAPSASGGTARHVKLDAPAERMEDADIATGGKHRA